MDINGEFRILAPRQQVWEALNDPEVLRQCVPGCEAIEKVSDTEFTANMLVKLGPVKAKFTTRLELSDLNPPESYTITGEGKGGPAGFAKGSADVILEDDGGETVLRYTARVQPGGKLAQVGSRLMDGTARKMAADFFGRFAAVVAPEGEGSGHEDTGDGAESAGEQNHQPPPAGNEAPGPTRVWWIAGGVLAAAALILVLAT